MYVITASPAFSPGRAPEKARRNVRRRSFLASLRRGILIFPRRRLQPSLYNTASTTRFDISWPHSTLIHSRTVCWKSCCPSSCLPLIKARSAATWGSVRIFRPSTPLRLCHKMYVPGIVRVVMWCSCLVIVQVEATVSCVADRIPCC